MTSLMWMPIRSARFYLKGRLFDKIKLSEFCQIMAHQPTKDPVLNSEMEKVWENGALNLDKFYNRIQELRKNRKDPAA